MIVISGALVLVALILLIIGVVGPDLTFVYASIGVSLVSLVFLVIGILQRRGETAPAAESAPAPEPAAQDEPADAVTAVIPAQARASSVKVGAEPPIAATADEELEYGGTVLVVEGRPRYHVDGCRYLSGKDAEEVDVLDAREEGFTPCGVCKPDEALEAMEDEDEPFEDEYDDEYEDDSGEEELVEEDVPGVEIPAPARRSSARGRTAAEGPAAPAAKAPAKTAKAPAKSAAAPTKAAKAPAKAAATAPVKLPAKGPAKASGKAAPPAKTAAVGRGPARPAAAKAPSKAAAAAIGSTPAAATAASRPGSVVVIPDRGKFHRADCRYVRDVPDAEVLTKSAASRQGYAACGVCKP